jgi:hypothetical protein
LVWEPKASTCSQQQQCQTKAQPLDYAKLPCFTSTFETLHNTFFACRAFDSHGSLEAVIKRMLRQKGSSSSRARRHR